MKIPIVLFAGFVSVGCAIDTPTRGSAYGGSCGSRFDLNSNGYAYFDYTGQLNGATIVGTAIVTPVTPPNAPATRQIILGSGVFSLTVNLTSSAYGTKTIAAGNPEVWMSAFTCGDFYNCSSEKYVAGVYNTVLRGSGTATLARTATGNTQIAVNATLPDENTSVSQTMQFQNVVFTEACY